MRNTALALFTRRECRSNGMSSGLSDPADRAKLAPDDREAKVLMRLPSEARIGDGSLACCSLLLDVRGGPCCGGNHLSALTPREREVFFMTIRGMSARKISEQLGIRNRTVETHRQNVLWKLGLRGAIEATHFAVLHGYLLRRLG